MSTGVAAARARCRGQPPGGGPVDLGQAGGELPTPAVGRRRALDGVDRGHRRPAPGPVLGVVGEVDVPPVGGAVAGGLQVASAAGLGGAVAGGVHEVLHHLGPGGGLGQVGVAVVAVVLQGEPGGGRGQARPVGVDRAQGGRLQGLVHQADQALVVEAVGAPRRGPAVDHQLEAGPLVVLGHVLVDERVGEAGERRAPLGDRDLGLGPVVDDHEDLEGLVPQIHYLRSISSPARPPGPP